MQTDLNKFMQKCRSLAAVAEQAGNTPVGAVLVHDGEIIGEGIEAGTSSGDITRHAEIEAVRDAIVKGHKALLPAAVLYTTHEPCIMCSYVLRHHRISRIFFEYRVTGVGGYSSPLPVLSTTMVPQWGTPPDIVPLTPGDID